MSTSTQAQATEIRLERRDGIAVLTLDGASTRNALDAASAADLVEACHVIDADESIGAAIIRGANATFCSGAVRSVLTGLASEPPHVAYEALSGLYEAFTRVGQLRVPTIACVEGAAVGAGLNLALVTDQRIASVTAKFISGFAPLGIHPGGGHLHLLERAAGRPAAAALGVFGRPVSARQAEALGLVWAVAPESGIDQILAEMTGHLGADPALARALKASLQLTTSGLAEWSAAIEVERARQLWSLSRPRGKAGKESRR